MPEQIQIKRFSEINLDDPFFDSLKADYPEFTIWFKSKSDAKVFVQYNSENLLQAFLYLKIEDEELTDVIPNRPHAKRLKVGTFKIDAHNTKLGERFIKKIMDVAITQNVDEVYVTIFNKHDGLVNLLSRYGFVNSGKKGQEEVLVKNMRTLTGKQLTDFPLFSTTSKRKFLLSIYPEYHTKLFPDSILRNEESQRYDLIRDVSFTNSIHKIYICFMQDASCLQAGDLIAIYRTKDGAGPARFRSVVTSICEVEEVKTKSDFKNLEEFIEYTNKYSIFEASDLEMWYRKPNLVVIKMTYNMALNKRVTRGYMLDNFEFKPDVYWGFFQLSDAQFKGILDKGEVYENIIIN